MKKNCNSKIKDFELAKAISLLQEYKLDEAQIAFEELLKKDPKNLDVLLHLAKIHSKTQSYGKALNYFGQAIDIDKNNTTAKTGIQLIQNILQLTNNFYFENSYTDEDLYEN